LHFTVFNLQWFYSAGAAGTSPTRNCARAKRSNSGGFRANQGMQVGIWGGIPSYYVVTDGNGSFSLTYTPGSGSFDTASPYTAFAAKFKGHRLETLAEAPFTVCSTNPCQ